MKYAQHLRPIIPRQTYGKIELAKQFHEITAARVGTVDMMKRKTSLVMIHIMMCLNLGDTQHGHFLDQKWLSYNLDGNMSDSSNRMPYLIASAVLDL